MTQKLMQDEDELPTFVNIELKRSFIHISCALFMCLLKGTLMLQKPLDVRFLLSAIMSQSKLKPNHKLVPSQIQLTDSRSLCFFEKPLMLAGGFCTHRDGNE